MTRPLFEDLLAQLPEMETRILADEVVRLRARVAELESEVNLLHRQRHAAQEDAANARLLAAVCHPAPDVRGELEILREGFGLMRTAYNTHVLRDYQNVLAEQIITKFDALRSGETEKEAGHG